MISLPNPPGARVGVAGAAWEMCDASLTGSIVKGTTCVNAPRGEVSTQGKALEVRDAGTRGAVREYFRARNVLRDGLANGRRHSGRAGAENAAGDYRRAGSGMEMHGTRGAGVEGGLGSWQRGNRSAV